MRAHRFLMALMEGIFVVSAAVVPSACLAQENAVPHTVEPQTDIGGCPDLKQVPRLPGSLIVSCDKGDSMAVTLPLNPDAQGYAREKSVRGFYESREYKIPPLYQQQQAFDNLMNLLPMAGFTVKYTSAPATITARNREVWVLINIGGEYYDVKAVRAPEDPWIPVKNAQEISREMEAHSRVAIYGIEFSPDNLTVIEERSKILGEVLAYLRGNAGLTVDIESHRMGDSRNSENDLEITAKRAQAVSAWLASHGIAAERLRPKALGRNKPITENDTPIEIQRNERIELVKTAP